MICYVFKRRRRTTGELHESRQWFGALRMDWETVLRKWSLGTPDKREAERLLQAERVLVEKRHYGLVPLQETTEAREQPLNALLDAYLSDRREHGRSKATIHAYDNMRVMFGRCGWRKLADVTPRSFLDWRKGSPLAANNKNQLLRNTRTFFHWMRRARMVTDDPLEFVELLPVVNDARHRRAGTPDEVQRLLDVAPLERFAVYLTAVCTGLRRSELQQVTVEDFVFDTPQPFLRVRPSIAKNDKEATLPLRPEVVNAVRAVLPDYVQPFERVFAGMVPRLPRFKKDLALARIPFETSEGRFDLHSLRVTFCTNLSAAGVAPRVAMELMRHSDIRLTMKTYTDPARLPLAAAIASLPVFKPSSGSNSGTQNGTQTGTQMGVAGGLSLSQGDAAERAG